MNWIPLQSLDHLDTVLNESAHHKILIYKHSTRCSISRTALDRLERNWAEEFPDTKNYFLDLLSFRDISNAIAERFDVEHQSPQVLIISKGKSIYDRSHLEIDYHQIKDILKSS
jgi:bacillithiol system protein YtxJ